MIIHPKIGMDQVGNSKFPQ